MFLEMQVVNNFGFRYSHPKFALLLYAPSSILGLLLGHYIGNILLKRYLFVSFQSFVCGHLTIDVSLLFYLNMHSISSSVFLWLWIVCPFLFVCVVAENLNLRPEWKDSARWVLASLAGGEAEGRKFSKTNANRLVFLGEFFCYQTSYSH